MSGSSDALPMTSAYFSLILREYGATARDRAALLDGTGVRDGLGTETAPEITLGQQLCQIRNATRWLEPGWALSMGARFHPATHGPIGFGVVSAPTVRQSVEVMTRFSPVRAPHFRLRTSMQGRTVRLVPEDRVELGEEERRALLDIVMLSTQGLVESALGRRVSEARFEFSYAAPAYARSYHTYFHAPVCFGREESAVVLPAEWLDLECPLADPVMFEASLRSLVAGERRLDGGSWWAARVEQLCVARGAPLGVNAVARLMRVSRRTLTRRLRDEGTSYRGLRDAGRKRHAESLLRDQRLDVSEVAYALGYRDAANFGRACRRWFGTSPGQHRRRLLDGG